MRSMPSLEGLKTWFDYQLLITLLVFVLSVVVWSVVFLEAYLRSLSLTTAEFVLAVTAFGLGAIIFLVLLATRYN